MGKAISTYGKMGAAIKKAGGVIKLFTSPASIAVIIITAIALAALLVIKNWDKIQATFQKVAVYIKKVMKDAGISASGFVVNFKSAGKSIANIIKGIIGYYKALWGFIKPIINLIILIIKAAIPTITAVVMSGANTIMKIISGVLKVIEGIILFLKGVFTLNWKDAWEGIKKIFAGVFESLGALATAQLNVVIAIINTVIGGINKLGLKIPDWVPKFGGKEFKINVKAIPQLYTGTDFWPGGPAMIHDRGAEIVDLPRGARVYPHEKSMQMAAENGRRSAQSKNVDDLKIIIEKIADTIIVNDDEDIEAIAEKVVKMIVMKLKKAKFNMGTVMS